MPREEWYCCLNPRERQVMHSIALALAVSLYVGVPVDLWDAMWLATGYTDAAYKTLFSALYGLEIVTIGEGDDEVSVVRPVEGWVTWWIEAAAFELLPASLCPVGCTLPSY